jgi:hypothetical protein
MGFVEGIEGEHAREPRGAHPSLTLAHPAREGECLKREGELGGGFYFSSLAKIPKFASSSPSSRG